MLDRFIHTRIGSIILFDKSKYIVGDLITFEGWSSRSFMSSSSVGQIGLLIGYIFYHQIPPGKKQRSMMRT